MSIGDERRLAEDRELLQITLLFLLLSSLVPSSQMSLSPLSHTNQSHDLPVVVLSLNSLATGHKWAEVRHKALSLSLSVSVFHSLRLRSLRPFFM